MSGGILLVMSAPSGAGKHTVLAKVFASESRLAYSISATTRAPRAGEQHGREYYFLSRADFEGRVARGEFLEWAEVHGNLYGTLRAEVDGILDSGRDVVLEIDVQGMRRLREGAHPFVSVFIAAPSLAELERRLRGRATEGEAQVALRLANARTEMAARREYDYTVVNDVVDRAAADLLAILRAERCRTPRVTLPEQEM